MTTATQIPADQLADLANADTQRLAARMAQDVFAGVFRQAAANDGAPDVGVLGEVAAQCANWCRAGGSDEARALRLALLIGGLRTRLDAREESRFQQYFEQLDAVESDAIDFKVDLRRGIHLALWHAMAASESAEQVEAIVHTLGSLMIALDQKMPELGWRLVADALAHIQIGLLSGQAPASPLAQEGTQQLFASLRHALPDARYQAILAHSGQAVVAWQQAARSRAH